MRIEPCLVRGHRGWPCVEGDDFAIAVDDDLRTSPVVFFGVGEAVWFVLAIGTSRRLVVRVEKFPTRTNLTEDSEADVQQCEPETSRGAGRLEKYEDVAVVARREGSEDEGHDADP